LPLADNVRLWVTPAVKGEMISALTGLVFHMGTVLGAALSGRPLQRNTQRWRGNIPGALAAIAIHILLVLAILFSKGTASPREEVSPIVTVLLTPVSNKTYSLHRSSDSSDFKARRLPKFEPKATAKASIDELQVHLNALAKLTQPQTSAEVANISGAGQKGMSAGGQGYELRDLIRAQVLRHWILAPDAVGTQNFDILIKVVLNREGKVLQVEVVDKQRYADDPVFRDLARRARNAVILASPFVLPVRGYTDPAEIILKLNPRDALH
jgi:hypothetical protein